MQTDPERSEQIDRYLAGEMPEAERQAFETALENDPALAEAVALHRALRASLGNPRRRQLLDALTDVTAAETEQPKLTLRWFSAYRMAAAAAVLALAAALGIWWYARPDSPEQPLAAEQPATQPAPPQIPVVSQEHEPEPGRLALADPAAFTPNPALDPMAGTFIRGGAGEVRLTKPVNDAVLPVQKGSVRFALQGKTPEANALTLHIYNNKEADFAAGKPVFSTEVPVQDSVFVFQTVLRLTPGRYYALLTAPGEDEPMLVRRFFVGRKE